MARHDYICGECQTVLLDQVRSVAEGASARPPLCPQCGEPMSWIPQARFDLRSDSDSSSKAAFAKFSVYDGHNNLVEIDSLHTLRRVERESEQAARNGEGQQMTFRAYSQDRSNLQQSTIPDPPPTHGPSEAGKRKYGLRGGAQALGSAEPDVAYGPGVTDENTSALPLSGK